MMLDFEGCDPTHAALSLIWNKLADCGVHGFGRFIIQRERL
jgi:hypothetical protein